MPWIQTYTGKRFILTEPTVEMVDIEDIAHALSSIARFNGHTSEPYSVAQHSVWVSEHVHEEYALEALLHDAAEAYIGDIATPLKRLLAPQIVEIEDRIRRVVCEAFGIRREDGGSEIKYWDLVALVTERRDLLGPSPAPWGESIETKIPVVGTIKPWHPMAAKAVFLRTFRDLVARRNTNQS